MTKRQLYQAALLAALLQLTACSTNDNPADTGDTPHGPTAALDPGPAYTEKSVSVTRDGKPDGEVTLRFYSDMPSVAYIAASDFHYLISDGGTMTVERQGGSYLLTTKKGHATIDVEGDRLHTPSLCSLTFLADLVDPTLPVYTSYDGSKYLRVNTVSAPSPFGPATTTLDLGRYGIDLHDDGSQVYFPFATLADMYSDGACHGACYNGKRVSVNTRVMDIRAYNTSDPEFAAEPYKQKEVAADMARFRYQELCFVFDYLYGYPGRSILENSGMRQYGLDATLDKVDGGKAVKQLLQSPVNTEFLCGMNGLQPLIYDGGHTVVYANAAIPKAIADEQTSIINNAMDSHPEVAQMYAQYYIDRLQEGTQYNELLKQRQKVYGDNLYCLSSDRQTAVIILNSFNDMDSIAWKKYYASPKGDADWKELLSHYKSDNFITFLYGLTKAQTDGVKNVIIDVSCNLGGSSDLVAGSIGIIGQSNKATIYYQNVMESISIPNEYLVDRNFDGKFDDLDTTHPKIDCSAMRLAVLTSRFSFSCGNLFPSLMQGMGHPILGEQSGGGTCTIQPMTTANGFQYTISGHALRLTNAKGENIDSGVTPDISFSYDHFFDIDYLGRRLSEWK